MTSSLCSKHCTTFGDCQADDAGSQSLFVIIWVYEINGLFHTFEQIWAFSLLVGRHNVGPQSGVNSKEVVRQSHLKTSPRAESQPTTPLFLIKMGSGPGPFQSLVEISHKHFKTLYVQCVVVLWSFETRECYQFDCFLGRAVRSYRLYFHHYPKRKRKKG